MTMTAEQQYDLDFQDTGATRTDLISQLERKGVFYTVELMDNYFRTPQGMKSTGKKTVVNVDLEEAIGVVSERYVPVLNKDIFTQFNKVLENCKEIDLTDAYVEVQTNSNGARILVEYVLPAHTVTLENGDEVALSITALNSFDGSTGFKVFCGGLRFKCMNGMILGSNIASYHKKHCSGLSIAEAGKTIETGIKAYLEGVDSWNNQIKTVVSGETCFTALAELCDLETLGAKTYAGYKHLTQLAGDTRKKLIDDYMLILEDYVDELGQTEWALNNAITHIVTHGARGKKPSIQSQVTKTAKAREIIKKHLS